MRKLKKNNRRGRLEKIKKVFIGASLLLSLNCGNSISPRQENVREENWGRVVEVYNEAVSTYEHNSSGFEIKGCRLAGNEFSSAAATVREGSGVAFLIWENNSESVDVLLVYVSGVNEEGASLTLRRGVCREDGCESTGEGVTLAMSVCSQWIPAEGEVRMVLEGVEINQTNSPISSRARIRAESLSFDSELSLNESL